MASEAQVVANRLNAQKSTGPRTPEGKTVVSQNAVKHGLLAKEAVVRGEDPGQFEFYRDQMLGELAPAGQMESVLAERVVSLSWRLQRAERLQTAAFDAMYEEDTTGPLAWTKRALRAKGEPGDDDLILGQMVVADFTHAQVLDRLVMYERRIEHSLYRTMAELQKQRRLRELEQPTEGQTPERASAVCSVPAWGERPRSPEEVGRERPTYEETPYGVTTNVPGALTVPLASLDLSVNQAQSPAGRETGTDSAKQSQSGAVPIEANLFTDEGLHQEGWIVPPQKQSQFPCRGDDGNAFDRYFVDRAGGAEVGWSADLTVNPQHGTH
jgi:hypothetical protein